MIVFHGTSAYNAASIIVDGFSMDAFYSGSLGKGIYFSRDIDKCVEYGRHILKVEIDEGSILKDDFDSISSFAQSHSEINFNFMSQFEKYTLSKGYKGLELSTFNEIVVYDLSCIVSISQYAVK
ncbi:hypothetical protein M3664_04440 [Paenibacillus lautus]|uniref:hypothetical protein n=1 Tax=Paenibacillus lautus TaxID=1401 RepID=UPI002040C471|nr:hypothetical protein [Paenibacillus lautus]MCM3257029.1 hypothetical protein [Paenibacillus lautus]